MQANQKIPKWELGARIRLYLGMSLQHARTVALLLSLTSGFMSNYMDFIITIRSGTVKTESKKIAISLEICEVLPLIELFQDLDERDY